MLHHLNIQGLAIIDRLSIEFTRELNILSGETGAGKSILVLAVNLLLGARTNADVVRKGCRSAVVSGTFEVASDHRAMNALENLGFPENESPGLIIIRREINAKGRSQGWINDVPATLAALREVGSCLVDVCGQHDNQRLLNPNNHNEYLDRFLPNPDLAADYQRAFSAFGEKMKGLRELVARYQERQKERDYLAFRAAELDEFQPSEEDFQRVSALCQDSRTLVEVRDRLQQSMSTLDGESVNSRSLAQAVAFIVGQLDPFREQNASLGPLVDLGQKIIGDLDELSFSLTKAMDQIAVDDRAIEEGQSRLATYQDLFRKLSVTNVEQLTEVHDGIRREQEFLASAEEEIQSCLTELSRASTELDALASRLSKQRDRAAKAIKTRVEQELSQLAMKQARFSLEFEAVQVPVRELDLTGSSAGVVDLWAQICETLVNLGECGRERCRFMLLANQGEKSLPLAKCASGGELSRIMLALKKTLASRQDPAAIVFDEIDAGISGRVADVVGSKLKDLSRSFQLICISHLAQVTAYADSHFIVEKYEEGQRTQSRIKRLDGEARLREVARLLSGDSVTKASRDNAKNLIDRAQSPS